ncbi:hypothetical protein ACH5RR_027487 [Cinchona calisaya]|uniref:Non-haem dioxygenase N-terminal domain-containing protein n=1 Tax=Cinchona calisaya TaxID=153742 RepID=A0ABD2Z8Z8_9GENT
MAPATTLTALAEEETLQEKFIRDEEEIPTVPYNLFSNEIPVISLAGINETDDAGRRSEICKKIVEACEDWGIFQVVEHGVDSDLISDMTRLGREFFALPPEEKLRFDMTLRVKQYRTGARWLHISHTQSGPETIQDGQISPKGEQ